MISFGAFSGGVVSELSGGNFWQGAVTGGLVAGLNHTMHKIKIESPKDIIILNASDGAGGKGNSRIPYGYVKEEGPQYRLGAAYIGWGNYRIGIDSDRYVRYPIQNIFAHGMISPQPGFIVLSNSITPYLQYQTTNKFTSW